MASNLTSAERLYSRANNFGENHPQRYKYSFSGADARMLVFFAQRPDLITYLDSVHTLSISVHEAKSQVRSLGYRGIKGLTRSVRTIAGSMILTVVNDHPLRPLIEQYNKMVLDINGQEFFESPPFGWSVDRDELGVGTHQDVYTFHNRLASLLPPFSLIMEFVAEMGPVSIDKSTGAPVRIGSKSSEYEDGVPVRIGPSQRNSSAREGAKTIFSGAGLMLEDIEFIDEGFVVSVNDMVTEVTLSFVARDFKPISANIFYDQGKTSVDTEIKNKEWELWKKMYGEERSARDVTYTREGGEDSFSPLKLE